MAQSDIKRCGFVAVCYLAESLNCFGYDRNCTIYRPEDGNPLSYDDFHEAIDQLIRRAKDSSAASSD